MLFKFMVRILEQKSIVSWHSTSPWPILLRNCYAASSAGEDDPPPLLLPRYHQRQKPDNSTSPFGRLYAIDDPLTVGPELTSMVIGNAQGLYLSLSRDPSVFTAVLYVDFAFTSGRFNGSSFSLFSRYAAVEYDGTAEPEREMAIVGGRGAFRMARGFAQTRGISTNATTGNAITEFNVTLYHY
ncbi:hypothetical protein V6N12_055920 [Hibiscus sabdariffa]|uniref:Dirigent protein n=1 Tax=Hibiscus sabdariffa TaxID=183260 RepID=A0ABR2CQZ2_9ROSI